ncbi:hypothetical protein BPOR_0039g00240 [Botrytis porri]|uniref:Uncharacterized protein n=1 Tax=Botrytis porri TaxID=87229 RepID=A0A4Z1L2T3_9HELO|nr:hypothetical protein BPOR_0039g00240 [Botrytis porri]
MALIFWHGGNLLADVKLEHVELWIVVLAILSGGEGEGAAELFCKPVYLGVSEAGHFINRILGLRSRVAPISDGTTSQQKN